MLEVIILKVSTGDPWRWMRMGMEKNKKKVATNVRHSSQLKI